jgi:hypothetical protein
MHSHNVVKTFKVANRDMLPGLAENIQRCPYTRMHILYMYASDAIIWRNASYLGSMTTWLGIHSVGRLREQRALAKWSPERWGEQ